MTTTARGGFVDRRRVELVDDGLPTMPHHHEGQKLPIEDAVALVERVRAVAEKNAVARLAALAKQVDATIVGIALRECPPLPETVAERITNYRAMCVADWVMYRQALARAATQRGWAVHWFDARTVLTKPLEALTSRVREQVGPPWQKDHKVAMAAAITAWGSRRTSTRRSARRVDR